MHKEHFKSRKDVEFVTLLRSYGDHKNKYYWKVNLKLRF